MKLKDIMSSDNKQQSIVILFITVIALTVIIAIYVIINIWMPKEEKKTEITEREVGTFEIKTFTEDQIVTNYFMQFYSFTISGDYEGLYNMLDGEYIEHGNVTLAKLKNLIEAKNIVGKKLVLEQYKIKEVDGYSKIYIIYYKTEDNTVQDTVTIKVVSPKEYSIAFGNFLSYKEPGTIVTKNGIEFTLNSILINKETVEIHSTIKNLTTTPVIINNDQLFNSIKGMSDNQVVSSISDNIGNQKIELTQNDLVNLVSFYSINEDTSKINGIYVKGFYAKDNRSEDIVFSF